MFIEQFIEWSHKNLFDNDEAIGYLRGRGVSESQWVKHKLGYISGNFLVDETRDPEHNEKCLDKEHRSLWCDSCRYNWWSSSWVETGDKYDDGEPKKKRVIGNRIKGSIVLPLTTYSGGIVGFQIRSLVDKSYDTFALKRRPEAYFFGLGPNVDRIWSTRSIFLVEGPFDALVFERLVNPNVVALTTNKVNKLQIKFLRRFVDTVYLLLDLDAAGVDGVNSFIKFNSDDFRIHRFEFPKIRPGDKDLGDFWKHGGDEKFKKHFERLLNEFK